MEPSESVFFQHEKCHQNNEFVRTVTSTDAVKSSLINADEVKTVVDQLCTCVITEIERAEDGLAKTDGAIGLEMDTIDGAIGLEMDTTTNGAQQQQQSASDESAMCRFGISANMEIEISCKEFQRLLRSINLKMAQKQKSNGKRVSHPRKTKAMAAEKISAKMPRRNASATANGKQRKTLETISEFDEVMASFLQNSMSDPIFKKCTEIQGMTDVAAYRIFHINQFLCHFITLIPEDKLGYINNKNSFTTFNMSIVQKAVDDREGPEMLDEKMMLTLATTVKYVQDLAQCREGIAYARRSFPRLDHFLLLTQV